MSKDIRRVAVLDADGVKINTILVDADALDTYWPGYGAALIDEGPEKPEPDPAASKGKPEGFGVVSINLAEPFQVGDRVDLKTGVVTKAEVKG